MSETAVQASAGKVYLVVRALKPLQLAEATMALVAAGMSAGRVTGHETFPDISDPSKNNFRLF